MKTEAELTKLKETALKQAKASRAADYWNGIHDAIDWVMGGAQPAIEIWLEIADIKPGPRMINAELPEPDDGEYKPGAPADPGPAEAPAYHHEPQWVRFEPRTRVGDHDD